MPPSWHPTTPRSSHRLTFRRFRDRICDRGPNAPLGTIAGRSVTCAAVPKRTRDRQLARQHERRQAERLQQQRKRQTTRIVVVLVIALMGGGIIAYFAFSGDDDTQAGATGSTGEPTGPTSSPKTVKPTPGPPGDACGGPGPE